MKLFLLFLVGLSSVHATEVYRWVDDNGNQVYTDQETQKAEKVELQESTIYTPVKLPEMSETTGDSEQEDSEAAAPNYQLLIVSPDDDATIRVNNGNVMVNLQVRPALDSQRGDLIQIYLDGSPTGLPMPQLSFMLEDVERGTHELSAVVLNDSGEVITRSEPITFHLQRTSLLQPGRSTGNSPARGAQSIPGFPTSPGLPTGPTNTP